MRQPFSVFQAALDRANLMTDMKNQGSTIFVPTVSAGVRQLHTSGGSVRGSVCGGGEQSLEWVVVRLLSSSLFALAPSIHPRSRRYGGVLVLKLGSIPCFYPSTTSNLKPQTSTPPAPLHRRTPLLLPRVSARTPLPRPAPPPSRPSLSTTPSPGTRCAGWLPPPPAPCPPPSAPSAHPTQSQHPSHPPAPPGHPQGLQVWRPRRHPAAWCLHHREDL